MPGDTEQDARVDPVPPPPPKAKPSKSDSGAMDTDTGAALRSVYQKTVEEVVPDVMLDLLGRLG